MGLFGRKKDKNAAPAEVADLGAEAVEHVVETPVSDAEITSEPEVAAAAASEDSPLTALVAVADRSNGPWDISEEPELGARINLGALRVPGINGMQLNLEQAPNSSDISAIAMAHEGSVLQVQVFAAPRKEGVWDEIRAEIAESVVEQGGKSDEVPGPFGIELLAKVPVKDEAGRSGQRPARFIGVDGPRWFLRAVLSGKGAVTPSAAEAFEALLAGIVVDRGSEAMAPRELLMLTVPAAPIQPVTDEATEATEAPEAEGVAETPAAKASDFNPLVRGPEITETR